MYVYIYMFIYIYIFIYLFIYMYMCICTRDVVLDQHNIFFVCKNVGHFQFDIDMFVDTFGTLTMLQHAQNT